MEIKFIKKATIITPLTPTIDEHECQRLSDEFIKLKSKQIALDLRFVNNCTIEFLELIHKYSKRLNIYNIQSDVFVLFNIMKCDKFINLYATEEDFLNNRYRLLNRDFKIA